MDILPCVAKEVELGYECVVDNHLEIQFIGTNSTCGSIVRFERCANGFGPLLEVLGYVSAKLVA